MRTIHKATIQRPVEVLQLPKGAKILTAQYQGSQNTQLCIWYECDPDEDKEPRTILTAGTGHALPDTHKLAYIATVQEGPFVWHILEALP